MHITYIDMSICIYIDMSICILYIHICKNHLHTLLLCVMTHKVLRGSILLLLQSCTHYPAQYFRSHPLLFPSVTEPSRGVRKLDFRSAMGQ